MLTPRCSAVAPQPICSNNQRRAAGDVLLSLGGMFPSEDGVIMPTTDLTSSPEPSSLKQVDSNKTANGSPEMKNQFKAFAPDKPSDPVVSFEHLDLDSDQHHHRLCPLLD